MVRFKGEVKTVPFFAETIWICFGSEDGGSFSLFQTCRHDDRGNNYSAH